MMDDQCKSNPFSLIYHLFMLNLHAQGNKFMSTLKEKTASGLLWSALNSGLMQLLNAVIGIFLARLLLPADYGLVGMLTIFSAITTTLQESGFTSALTNLEHPTDRDYNSVFWFSVLMGLGLYILLFLAAPWIAAFYRQPELVLLSRIDFLCILTSAIGVVPHAYLYKNMIIKQTTLLRTGVLLLSGVVGVTMAFQGWAYWSLVGQQLCYTGLLSIGKFALVPWRPSIKIDFEPVKRMFGFSSKILVTNIIAQVSQNILTVVFGRLFPVGTVGNFTQAWKWNNMASSTVVGMFSNVAQPVFATLQHDEQERQLQVLRKMIRFAAFLAFPLLLGLALVAHEFIILLISDKWADSAVLLQILCISGAFLALYTPLQNFIIAHKQSGNYLWGNVCQIVIQLAIVLLLSRYGIITMVTCYSLFLAVYTFVWYALTTKLLPYRLSYFLKDTLPFLGAMIIAMGGAWGLCRLLSLNGESTGALLLRFGLKGVVTAIIYFVLLKCAGAHILDECLHYLHHKGRA